MKRFLMWLVLAGLVLPVLPGCVTARDTGDDFSVRGLMLMRGEDPITMRAIEAPDLAAGGAELANIATPMARIAEVGGNTVAFNLPGFSADGTYIEPQAVADVIAITERAKDQHMGVLVRVLGAVALNDAVRENAVETAAKALAEERRAVYWIDGPNAGALAAKFESIAPELVTAAPANADLTTVESDALQPAASLLVGSIPTAAIEIANFVLPGGDEDYAVVDAALTNPDEKQEWVLDASVLSEAERAEGFVPLFDGKSLDGWWVFGENKQGFRVTEDGAIERAGEAGTALMTAKRYGDFILRLQYKIEDGGNSGIFIRAPRTSRQSRIGMEMQIHGDPGVPPSDDGTGAIYVVVAPTSNPSNAAGEWNDVEIMAQGDHLKITINGVVVQDINLNDYEELQYRLKRGFIGLQDHDSFVQFRNVRIKEL